MAAVGSLWTLKPKILALPYYFTMVNLAVFFGAYHAALGLRRMKWK